MTKMKIAYLGHLRTLCTHESGAKIETDAPKDLMGKGEAFSPTDLFAVSLGSCMITIMAIQGKKLGVELEGMTADVEKQMSSVGPRRIEKIVVRLRCPLLPNQMTREKLEKIAIECPIHRSLHPDVKVEFDFVWGV
jgi:putative redox protein